MRTLISLLFLLLFSLGVKAQYLRTVKFSKEETQLYNPIKGVYEDQKGYLWVYGLDGISRFNGQRFETIDELYPEAGLLPSKNCFSLSQSHGYLWIGTSASGLFGFDKKGSLKNFEELTARNSQLRSSRILQLQAFDDLLIILGEKGLEIFRKKGDLFVRENIPSANTEKITKTFVHKKALWLSDENSIEKLDLNNFEILNHYNYKQASFFTSPNGILWLTYLQEDTKLAYYSTEKEGWVLNDFQPYENYKLERKFSMLDNNRLISFGITDLFLQVAYLDQARIEHINEEESGLADEKFIRDSYQDRQGRNWLFGNELYLLPNESQITTEFTSAEGDEVLDMIISPKKVIASIRNKGLLIYNKKEKSKKILDSGNSRLADNFIGQLVDFRNGRIGLCMMNYFQIYEESKGFGKAYEFPGIIRSAHETENYYWVGGFKSLFRINKSTGDIKELEKPSLLAAEGSAINDIFPLGADSLMIATANDKMMKFDLIDEVFDIEEYFKGLVMDSFRTARTIDADLSPSGKKMAIATDVGIFYVKNGKRHQAPMKRTSYSNIVFHSDTILYATSKSQIYRINVETDAVASFDKLDGINNKYFAIRSSYRDDQGNLYFGGDQGVDKISDYKYSRSDSKSSLILDQLFLNGLPQFPEQNDLHTVPSNIQVVELKLNSPKNFSLEPMLLQTKFSNDTEWNTLSSNESFTLYNPSPGKMAPKFRLVDQNGKVASQETTVKLFVQQSWYKKPIFWIFTILFCSVLSAIFFFRYNKKKNDRKVLNLKLQEELASLKLTSLNAQMNPHFIFNALSSIQHLIASNEPEVAEEYLSKFSKLLRHVIQYASYENVSLAQEEKFIRNYLELELLRFDKAFSYKISNDIKEPSKVMIPPFFIQPQIENAIKHGLLSREKGGHIHIAFAGSGNGVKITIEDNGIGRKAASKQTRLRQENTKKGNFITQERIDNLNKLNYKSSYQIEDLLQGGKSIGTRVILEFENEPKNQNEQTSSRNH